MVTGGVDSSSSSSSSSAEVEVAAAVECAFGVLDWGLAVWGFMVNIINYRVQTPQRTPNKNQDLKEHLCSSVSHVRIRSMNGVGVVQGSEQLVVYACPHA